MAKVQGTDVEAEPNGVECIDCDRVYVNEEATDASEDFDTCPEDDEHAVSPVHITSTPLGLPNDRDHLVPPNGGEQAGQYIYTLDL